jgi:hypothetical protein
MRKRNGTGSRRTSRLGSMSERDSLERNIGRGSRTGHAPRVKSSLARAGGSGVKAALARAGGSGIKADLARAGGSGVKASLERAGGRFKG